MTDKLPCPFCGGEAEAYQSGAWLRDHFMWYVKCGGCFTATCDKPTEAEAIAAWNTRAERTCEVEVRESAWGGYTRHCGNCGADLDCDTRNKQNYCPNCGARTVER